MNVERGKDGTFKYHPDDLQEGQCYLVEFVEAEDDGETFLLEVRWLYGIFIGMNRDEADQLVVWFRPYCPDSGAVAPEEYAKPVSWYLLRFFKKKKHPSQSNGGPL